MTVGAESIDPSSGASREVPKDDVLGKGISWNKDISSWLAELPAANSIDGIGGSSEIILFWFLL